MKGYVTIHGHFYQPPRENAWLEDVEVQDSAAPFHDWNERITAECYRPNGWSRILDEKGDIQRIVNNYASISFDVGPTLLHWLDRHAPEVHEAVLRGDRESRGTFGGHGCAMAQAYNHLIMPLASLRDKRTQVRWALQDFEHRFGRPTEGMWLPETAADLETLGVLAEEGVRFTVLSPYQAKRIREKVGEGEWREVPAGAVPTTRPYLVRLPEGRSLPVFFYNGGLSHEVAFGGLLDDGHALAGRLVEALGPNEGDSPRLSHIATDGETFGHHHRYGDMALAAAIEDLKGRSEVHLTNYGEFLAMHPPTAEVEIVERSSWSCVHGVERWRSNCGCSTGGHPRWNQRWRSPLREALDALREGCAGPFEDRAKDYLKDPWAARDGYVHVLLGQGGDDPIRTFLDRHATRTLGPEETVATLELLELQRHAQQMFTSCGWFFDELTGIETVQVLQYAGRVLQLAEKLFPPEVAGPLRTSFLERLAGAQSNLPAFGNGRQVFAQRVQDSAISLRNVCAHFALSSLFEDYAPETNVYSYRVRATRGRTWRAGKMVMVTGHSEVTSERTRETGRFTFGALYLGGYDLFGGVRPFQSEEAYEATKDELVAAFEEGKLPQLVHVVDRNFGEGTYTLRLLFRDEQRRIVDRMLETVRESVETSFRRIYETSSPILVHLSEAGSPAPRELVVAAEFHLNAQIRKAFEREPPDLTDVSAFLRELRRLNLSANQPSVGYAWTTAAEREMEKFAKEPLDMDRLREVVKVLQAAREGGTELHLRRLQDQFYELIHGGLRPKEGEGPPPTGTPEAERVDLLRTLAELLRVRFP